MRKLSKQNDDKSIESVKVEVHFAADVRFSHACTGMLKNKLINDEWTWSSKDWNARESLQSSLSYCRDFLFNNF